MLERPEVLELVGGFGVRLGRVSYLSFFCLLLELFLFQSIVF